MSRSACATDLAAADWDIVEPDVRTSGLGRPPLLHKRALRNAIFYQLRAGGAWHLLPHDLPPWRTAKYPLASELLVKTVRLSLPKYLYRVSNFNI